VRGTKYSKALPTVDADTLCHYDVAEGIAWGLPEVFDFFFILSEVTDTEDISVEVQKKIMMLTLIYSDLNRLCGEGLPRDACTLKNFISARWIYRLYILNLIETSRKKQLLIMFSMRFRSFPRRIF